MILFILQSCVCLFVVFLAVRFFYARILKHRSLDNITNSIDNFPASKIGPWIALAAGLALYNELMIIRLHSSYFHLFAYFKNISLLSCFLGLGIGFARASQRPLALPLSQPLLGLQIILLSIFYLSPVKDILHNPIPEQLILGIDQAPRIAIQTVFSYAFLIVFFAFNAVCFVPLGHLISRLMMKQPPLTAYSWNLAGSLAGILVFTGLSFLCAPPYVWFMLSTAGILPFFTRNIGSAAAALLTFLVVLFFILPPFQPLVTHFYSPYQTLTLDRQTASYPVVGTNNVYYQRILDLRPEKIHNDKELQKWAAYYNLPYNFKPQPAHVLVVGSGTGNDVAAAVRNGAGEIDAVEIDPVILKIGRKMHQEAPYQAKNVRVTVDDARAFIRHTTQKYDLIVYGLLDSHTLLSNKSGGIRLDSYVYTVEALKEARKKLNEGGVISLTFCMLRAELGRKLVMMFEEAFDGQKPIIYRAEYDGGYTFLAGDNIEKLGLRPNSNELIEVSEIFDEGIKADKSTDDWPFFYMPLKTYPVTYFVMMLLLLGVSLIFIRRLTPGLVHGFSVPAFFLGAGFMLVETKGITELARIYGSTWIVISIVIACILLMAFGANLLTMRKSFSFPLIYVLLFSTITLGFLLTYLDLSNLHPVVAYVIMPVILTLPLFFSGMAFSHELRKLGSSATAISSNLLGAMLGGFLEYNAMYFGYRSLYLFAFLMYALAFIGSMRKKG